MKKLLLGTAAVAMGLSLAATQASAQVKLDVGGHTKLYASWLDQDTADTAANGDDVRDMDILRETEVHFTGETTLDNGLTVGGHIEVDVDGTDSSFAGNDAEEAYAYFSGAWGRVNFGREDGASYLLQVAAPSADSNHDGIRQWISAVNVGALPVAAAGDNLGIGDLFNGNVAVGAVAVDTNGDNAASATDIRFNAATVAGSRFDYDQAVSGFNDKLTYMTPVFNGFQAGVSYTPDLGNSARDYGTGNADVDSTGGYGDVWDLAARYEGQFDQIGVALGGGWTHAALDDDNNTAIFFSSSADAVFTPATETAVSSLDDREAWNVGIDFDWQAFGLGAAYMEDDNGVSNDDLLSKTWVVGADYTTGPFKLGASYYDQKQSFNEAELEAERWTGGVVYTYGPGMTFRGSVSWLNLDEDAGFANSDSDATTVLLGTQINF